MAKKKTQFKVEPPIELPEEDNLVERTAQKLGEETAKLRVKMLKSLMGVKTYNRTMKNGGQGMTIKVTPQITPADNIKQEKQHITFRTEPNNPESTIEEIEVLETVAIDVKKPSIRIVLSGRHLSTKKLAEYTKMV